MVSTSSRARPKKKSTPHRKHAHDVPDPQGIRRLLLAWYRKVRRDLPWRRTQDPYAIWLSEVMLQQTRVETVIPYYARFLEAFPTVLALAEAPLDRVLGAWSGLGYYRRARMLHEGAQELARSYAGELPRTSAALRGIRGIGPYTAGAVASIAFGEAAALVDGNVHRVLARLYAIDEDDAKTRKRAWEIAEQLVKGEAPGDFNQALMELGATVCTPRPKCDECPVASQCRALAEGRETSLPRPKKRPEVPTLERTAMVVERPDRAVLLARCGPEGRFAGLWEPPMVDGAVGAKAFGLGSAVAAGEVVHVLTHRRLQVHVLRGSEGAKAPKVAPEYAEHRWVLPADAKDIGVSTLCRKVLRKAGLAW